MQIAIDDNATEVVPTTDYKTALEECFDLSIERRTISKPKLNHTPVEHQLYQFMLKVVTAANTRVCTFSLRQFMTFTRLPNYSAIRRGLEGLVSKHSIERYKIVDGGDSRRGLTVYFVYPPEEIVERRAHKGVASASGKTELSQDLKTSAALERLIGRNGLSRREAEVALCCIKGLTNSEIGRRLYISEQTVKFHLRHVFVKYGVKRRTELISQLLSQAEEPAMNDKEIE